jgi:hypothetical protein
MNKEYLGLYTDFLLSTFVYATATGLSAMVSGQVSHDQITRFLSDDEYTSKDLWLEVKSTVRKVEREDAVLIFDDTCARIVQKPQRTENSIFSKKRGSPKNLSLNMGIKAKTRAFFPYLAAGKNVYPGLLRRYRKQG